MAVKYRELPEKRYWGARTTYRQQNQPSSSSPIPCGARQSSPGTAFRRIQRGVREPFLGGAKGGPFPIPSQPGLIGFPPTMSRSSRVFPQACVHRLSRATICQKRNFQQGQGSIIKKLALTGSDQGRIHTDSFTTLRLFRRPGGNISDLSPKSIACNAQSVPFLPGRHTFCALLQEMPIAVQLFGGLIEITTVGRKGSLGQGDDGSTGRAGKARDEFYTQGEDLSHPFKKIDRIL